MSCKLVYLARRAAGVSREDWPRTWKSHAVFASRFPALGGKIDWMRYTNRVEIDLPGVSQAHDGVCVCAGPSLAGLNGSGFSAADRALIDADELRVFDMLTPNFTWLCREEVLRDGPLGDIAMFRFLGDDRPVPTPPHATRHVLNRPVHPPLPLFPYAAIAESWFTRLDDAIDGIVPIAGALTMLTCVCHRWPK